MDIRKIIALLIALCMVFVLFAGCGEDNAVSQDQTEEQEETQQEFPPGSYAAEHTYPEIEDTGATIDDIENPYNYPKELTDKEIDMIYILQNKSFDYYLDSMWELYFTCNDERLLNNGIPSNIQVNFMNSFASVQSVVATNMFRGEFILEDNRLTIPMDPELDDDDVIVMDIIDGNKLAYNKELSSADTEYAIVSFGPDSEKFDLDGIIFEIDIPQTVDMNEE